ncbi:MAG: VOC family protein [Actinomycetota bacterium]
MTLAVHAVTIDCRNAADLAGFWSRALDRPVDTQPPGASEFFASIGRDETPGSDSATGPVMMFIQVPEDRTVKNRVHLDLGASDRAVEVERLVGLGATVLHDKDEWGTRWTTLADPEGNEFCVAQSHAEH